MGGELLDGINGINRIIDGGNPQSSRPLRRCVKSVGGFPQRRNDRNGEALTRSRRREAVDRSRKNEIGSTTASSSAFPSATWERGELLFLVFGLSVHLPSAIGINF